MDKQSGFGVFIKKNVFLLAALLFSSCSNDPDTNYINLDTVPAKPQFYWQNNIQQITTQQLETELSEIKELADELKYFREEEYSQSCQN